MGLRPLFLTLSCAQSSAYQHDHQQIHHLSIDCKDSLWLNPALWYDIVSHLHLLLLPDLLFHRISYLMIMVICLPSPLCCTCSLHQCIQYQYNPLAWYIIQLLLAVSPKSLSHGSCLHRMPLYCCGDTCQVVQHAIAPDAYPAACFVQDMDGKTLLILVCNSSCALFENDCQETIWDPPSIKLIWTFIKAYPTSLLLEDNDGTSVLKHAILSEVSIEVVKVLQHAPAFMCARTGD